MWDNIMKWLKCWKIFLTIALSHFIILDFAIAQIVNPRLYLASNEKSLIVWQSDKNNDLYLAQFILSNYELEGNNFPIKSNELVAFNSLSDFMVTKTYNYPGSEYFNSSFSVKSWIYHSTLDTTNNISLTYQEWPFCGTGFLGFEEMLFSFDQRFLYVIQFDGQLDCQIYDNSGIKISEILGPNNACNITADGLPDFSFLVIWFNGRYDNDTYTLPYGIYATLFEENEIVADTILIKEYSRFQPFLIDSYQDLIPSLTIKALNDTSYQLFVIEPDSMLLYCYLLNRRAEIKNVDKFSIPIKYNQSSSEIPDISMFNLSNIAEKSRSIFISTAVNVYPNRQVTNYLYYFSDDGFSYCEPIVDTTQIFHKDCYKFKIGSDKFINPVQNGNEIRIDIYQDFSFIESRIIGIVNSLDKINEINQTHLYLSQNYPNPFNPETFITFSIPFEGLVKLIIYNNRGQLIKRIINRKLAIGTYNLKLDLNNLPSGLYYYQLRMNDQIKTRKMLLLK